MRAPEIQEQEGILVVRDDLVAGGTKARVAPLLFGAAEEYVYAAPVYGYAQVALAHAARENGKRATIFCAKRKARHPRTIEAMQAGARVIEIPTGYLNVVQCRARNYCAVSGAVLLPFGFDTPAIRRALGDLARSLPVVPEEVWTVAGSGTLTRSLQDAWPAARFHAVQVGKTPAAGRATVHLAPEKFEAEARIRPPFPSCSNYDAKAWVFVKRHASAGALFWNVAA